MHARANCRTPVVAAAASASGQYHDPLDARVAAAGADTPMNTCSMCKRNAHALHDARFNHICGVTNERNCILRSNNGIQLYIGVYRIPLHIPWIWKWNPFDILTDDSLS